MAKSRTVAGVEHVVYDSMEEFRAKYPEGLVNMDWRKGRDGDWVLGDDGSVMQVLKHGRVSSSTPREYIRTAAGTFVIWEKARLDSNFRDYIYSFGGHRPDPDRVSNRERVFASFLVLGCTPAEAYLKVFRTKNERFARISAFNLITKGKMMTAISDAIREAGERTEATLEWAMKTIKDTVEKKECSDSVKIRGASMIADLHTKDKDASPPGLGPGSFQGFNAGELPADETRQIEQATT